MMVAEAKPSNSDGFRWANVRSLRLPPLPLIKLVYWSSST